MSYMAADVESSQGIGLEYHRKTTPEACLIEAGHHRDLKPTG